jgi:HEPN domain-containing protein
MIKAAVPRNRAKPSTHLALSLKQNAYSFLNQSLRHYRKTAKTVQDWPFALLHITQSLELLLKQLLKEIHPILIYEDVDHPKRTVSLEQALTRLESIGVVFEAKERVNMRKAADYRNRVVHHEIELNKFEWKKVYAQLFEFVHFFHTKHLKEEIHTQIAKDNWAVEAQLMQYFKKNFVVYNGLEMYRENPKNILDAQRKPYLLRGRRKYLRIRYGSEPTWLVASPQFANGPCHDCFVTKGQYHAEGCDVEECPKCHSQLLGCGCWL